MSGYYDENEKRWVEMPPSVDGLVDTLATRTGRHEMLELVDEYRCRWQSEAVEAAASERQRVENERAREDAYHGVGKAILVTLDGLRVERRIDDVERGRNYPRSIKIGLRGETDMSKLEDTKDAHANVPYRHYIYDGQHDRRGLPIYEEQP